jgi:hypothetical protein
MDVTIISTDFDPLAHGFKFLNRFEFADLFKLPLGAPWIHTVGEVVYGLCGGMAYAALDYFYARQLVDAETDAEEVPLRLFRYLWQRQRDSLPAPVVQKLFTWLVLDDRILWEKVAQDEAPRLMELIHGGQPCVLLLVRTHGLERLTLNHQVLATAYEFDASTHRLTVQLYDPNHPQSIPTLSMDLSRPGRGINLSQSTGEPIRGFFVSHYERAMPPGVKI